MNDGLGLNYPFSVRIDGQKKSQLAYWSRKFFLEEKELEQIIQVAGPNLHDINSYLQNLRPSYVRTLTHPQVLAQYEAFIQTAAQGYRDDLASIPSETSTLECWPLLLNEAVEEAGRLAETHGRNVQDKLRLVAAMKGVAEAVLTTVSLNAETGNKAGAA